ncbi:putative transcriptional regulatory protein [Penicillium brevicompactum]
MHDSDSPGRLTPARRASPQKQKLSRPNDGGIHRRSTNA